MIDTVARRYGVALTVLRPDPGDVAENVARHGEFAFYESLELRKACCAIRKVAPLRMALRGRSAWLTGQRRTQSQTRTRLAQSEFDEVFGLFKYNPLRDWTAERSEEHTSELQSLMRISYAVFCLKKKKLKPININ